MRRGNLNLPIYDSDLAHGRAGDEDTGWLRQQRHRSLQHSPAPKANRAPSLQHKTIAIKKALPITSPQLLHPGQQYVPNRKSHAESLPSIRSQGKLNNLFSTPLPAVVDPVTQTSDSPILRNQWPQIDAGSRSSLSKFKCGSDFTRRKKGAARVNKPVGRNMGYIKRRH